MASIPRLPDAPREKAEEEEVGGIMVHQEQHNLLLAHCTHTRMHALGGNATTATLTWAGLLRDTQGWYNSATNYVSNIGWLQSVGSGGKKVVE